MNFEARAFAKECGFEYDAKMDAVNLQGVWPTFPISHGVVSTSIGANDLYAARRIILELLEEEAKERRERGRSLLKETPEQTRNRLLQKMVKRLEEEEVDDLVTLLTA